MRHRDEIIAFLDDLLKIGSFEDYGPNGLQVRGAGEVSAVVSGVSASLELIERARDTGAELVLVHHGLFWRFHPVGLRPVLAARLRVLLGADINLAAYHLPLDAHPEHGNNALIADGLRAEVRTPWGEVEGAAIGCVADFGESGVPAQELFDRVTRLTGRKPLCQGAGPETVRRLGIVSGGATSGFYDAIADGLDGYLTGEVSEWVMAEAQEAGLHYIAAGHYATETFGVRRLGELVAQRFGVAHEFVDVPNPV